MRRLLPRQRLCLLLPCWSPFPSRPSPGGSRGPAPGLDDKPLTETQAQVPGGAQSRPAWRPKRPLPPRPGGDDVPEVDLPPIEGDRESRCRTWSIRTTCPGRSPCPARPPTSPRRRCGRPSRGRLRAAAAPLPSAPITPGSQRVTSIFPRSGRKVDIQFLPEQPDGTRVVIYRGGVNIVTKTPKQGIVDIESESAVIWRHPDPKKGEEVRGPNGELIENANQPMEVYLEGNVILRQDEKKIAGKGDQRTFRAIRAYYDFLTDRFVGPRRRGGRLRPGLHRADEAQVAPDRAVPQADPAARRHPDHGPGPRDPGRADHDDRQPVPQPGLPDQQPLGRPDPHEPVADRAELGASPVGNPDDPNAPMDLVWRYDARQNVFWMGWLPVFYWPRFDR